MDTTWMDLRTGLYPTLPADPAAWLYGQGVAQFWADAFAEWVRTDSRAWMSLSDAKRESDYCPRMAALYRTYGSRTTYENGV